MGLRSWLAKAPRSLWSSCSKERPLSKEDRITLLALIIAVGFCIAVSYHYAMGLYFRKEWPANTFLYLPKDRFGDFALVVRQSSTLDPFGVVGGSGFAGTPFGQFVGYLFSVIRPASLRLTVFLGSFFIGFIILAKHSIYGLKARLTSHQLLALFAVVFLTYPVLFAVDRANFDLLVLPCLFLFAIAYARHEHRASTVFLGLAIAIKPYAAVFILIYIFDRRYKDTLLTVFNALVLTVLSLALFKDGLFVETQKYFSALWDMTSEPSFGSEIVYTSDLFSMLTVVARPIGDVLHWGSLLSLTDQPEYRVYYVIFAVVAFAYFAIHLWQKPKPLWKTMAVLTILIILLPFSTHDYRLIYLFVPMLAYLATNETTRNDLLIVVLWGLLLVPKNYHAFDGAQNIGIVINPLLLLGLLISIVPEAFSRKGVVSTFRFSCARVCSVVRVRRLANLRSN